MNYGRYTIDMPRDSVHMKINLDIPFGEGQQQFLDYLSASLRKQLLYSGGSAGYIGNGLFQSSVMGVFRHTDQHVSLEWKLVQNDQKTLLYLEVLPADLRTTEVDWQGAAREITDSAFASALAVRKQPFFRRIVFFYFGPELDGEYWLPGYRVGPLPGGEEHPATIDTERAIAIDLNIEAVDNIHASTLAHERARREASRLGLLLNVGFSESDQLVRWGLETAGSPPPTKSVRFRSSLLHPNAHAAAMPKSGECYRLGEYSGRLADEFSVGTELLSLPPETEQILRGAAESGPEVSQAFERCARLYQVALVCGIKFPSLGLAYRVAAIEAAAKANGTSDTSRQAFTNFMRRYVPPSRERDTLISFLYGDARSAHFHAGSFPLGEFDRGLGGLGSFMTAAEFRSQDSAFRSHELTRLAVANWLLTLGQGHAGSATQRS